MGTVRFGVVGTSWIADAFVEASREVSGVEVVAVCSRSTEGAAAFATRNAVLGAHTDLAGLAADGTVDAVYLASPNSLHASQATTMLRAGKHVLVEKPLGASAAEVVAVSQAARSAGCALMEAYMAAFLPTIAALRDALPGVGPVRRVVLVKDQYSSKYDRLKAGDVANVFNPDLAGGSLMDLGFYPVSLAVHLFGEPESVAATGLLLDTGADGQGTVLLGYDGFEVACLHSKIAPCGIESQVAGELGVITLDDCSVPDRVRLVHRLGSPGGEATPGFVRRPGSAQDLTPPQPRRPMRYEIEEFADLVRTGAPESPRHPTTHSLAVLRILDEARRQVGVRMPS